MAADDVHRRGSLGQIVLWSLRRWGDRPALISHGQSLSYAALADRVARALGVFANVGLGHGQGLGLMAPNSSEVMVATAAAAIAGVRMTPLSMLTSDEDLIWLIADAELDLLIVHDSVFQRVQVAAAQVARQPKVLRFGGEDDFASLLDATAPAPLVVAAQADDIALIGYTGGTTGRPKGVVHTHRSALAAVMMATAEWEWPSDLKVLAATPVSHAAGILAYPTWLKGGAFHLLPAFSVESFAAYVQTHGITATFLVPTMIYRLLDHAAAHGLNLAPLQTVLYGAAPMAVDRLIEALGRFGPIFMQLYGQTEAPTCVTYLARAQHDPARPDRLASCGMPLAGVDVSLRDDADQPVAEGQSGEICVRGPLVMQGYWRNPDESAKAMAGGWLRTGDVGRFDADGYLHIVDRKKDMIISGGFNIYPREVEDVIVAMPGVAACAVVGLPDSTWGEAVTAAVVAKGTPPSEAQIIAQVKARRGPAAAPKRIVFVDAIPMTLIGKLDKKALRQSLMAS